MTYRDLRARLQAIVDAAYSELETQLQVDPETELEKLPQPVNSEEHALYVECLFAAMGVRSVAASASKLLRSLDRNRAALNEGGSAEHFFGRVIEFAEGLLDSELNRFRKTLSKYRND